MRACNARNNSYTKAALLAGVAVAAAPVIALAQTAPADASSHAPLMEEVVVTAQRRSQDLQRVPVAVTALTQATLEANRVVDVRDLSSLAPNMTVRSITGGVQIPAYTIRGYLAQSSGAGVDRGIALYLDGVYVQNILGSIFQLADIERIEVLKGPQGTLFGRNATGGAVSITTRGPSGELGVEQRFTVGNYNQFVSKTRVDLPKIGPFKAAVTYVHSERQGDIRNLGAGTTWDYGPATGGVWGKRTSPKHLGDENTESVVAAVSFDPTADLSFNYKFDYAQSDYTSQGWGILQNSNATPDRALLYRTQPNPAILTQISRTRPDAVNNWFSTPGETTSFGHNLTATLQVNEQISLKNILSYRKSRTTATEQFDAWGGLINTVPALGALGQPYIALGSSSAVRTHQWSEEVIASLDLPVAHVTAGYIHFENYEKRGIVGLGSVLAFRTVPNFVIPGSTAGLAIEHGNSDAFYVQPEFHITDQIDLAVGYRLTMDKKTEQITSATPGVASRNGQFTKKKPTYLVGLNYTVNDDIFAYAKYSTGYISGGTFSTLPYAPETARSYEAGLKAYLFDRRLRSNIAVFSTTYKGLQQTTFATTIGLPAALGTVLINGADGKAKGFEVENTFVPMEGLTLTANVGYTDFTLRNQNPALGNPAFTRPGYRPKWTGSGSVQYEIPGPADTRVVMRLDAAYKSKQWLANFNLLPEVIGVLRTPSTVIVNARVALADIKLMGGTAELALWGRNLTDDKHTTFGAPYTGQTVAAAYERARTYGVDLSFKF
jgi:iron complex outermembrane receptor protein